MDGGESRCEEFRSPRVVDGFLKSWPSYSLPRQAARAGGGSKKTGRCEVDEIVASTSQEYTNLAQEICEGRNCHCKDRFGRKERKRKQTNNVDGRQQ